MLYLTYKNTQSLTNRDDWHLGRNNETDILCFGTPHTNFAECGCAPQCTG